MTNPAQPDKSFAKNFAAIPEGLVMKINGVATEDGFFYIGKCIADEIERAVGKLADLNDVLDFGCGIGRVMSQLLARAPRARFVGFDIDPQMLRWGAHFLEGAPVRFTGTTLDLPDQSFDLLIAISVFTHLDLTTDFWLSEVHRLLRPGARALLTYHDETLFGEMAAKGAFSGVGLANDAVLQDRFILGEGTAEGGALMGTFFTTTYWTALLSRYFEILETKPRGLFGHQSYSVVRPKPLVIDREAHYRIYAGSLEKDLFELRQRHEVAY